MRGVIRAAIATAAFIGANYAAFILAVILDPVERESVDVGDTIFFLVACPLWATVGAAVNRWWVAALPVVFLGTFEAWSAIRGVEVYRTGGVSLTLQLALPTAALFLGVALRRVTARRVRRSGTSAA